MSVTFLPSFWFHCHHVNSSCLWYLMLLLLQSLHNLSFSETPPTLVRWMWISRKMELSGRMFRVRIGFWSPKSKQELLLELLRDLGAGLQVESSQLCLRNPIFKMQWKGRKLNKRKQRKISFWRLKSRSESQEYLDGLRKNRLGLSICVWEKNMKSYKTFYVIVFSGVELALVAQQWTVSQWMFLS